MARFRLLLVLWFLSLFVGAPPLQAMVTDYVYGAQGSDNGGPHAIDTFQETIGGNIYDYDLSYDPNGDLSGYTRDGLPVLDLHYFVNRRLKKSTDDGTSATRSFYTVAGEKVATFGSDGTTNVFLEPFLRFTNETFVSLRIAGEIRWQEFESYGTLELDILSLVYHPHTAFAQFFEDAVVRDGLADHAEYPVTCAIR